MVKKKRQHDVQDDGTWTDSCDENSQSPGTISNNCQHVKKSVDTARLRKQLKTTGLLLECNHCVKLTGVSSSGVDGIDGSSSYEYDNTLWLCLKCGTQLCGRSKNQHALLHFKTPHSDSHALTINTRSFEIWCYDCDNEVSPNTRKNLLECVELVKKLAQKPPSIQTNAGIPNVSISASLEATAAAAATVADTVINNIENKIIATWEALSPLVATNTNNNNNNIKTGDAAAAGDYDENCGGVRVTTTGAIPLPPPLHLAFPGSAKRVDDITFKIATSSSTTNIVEIGRMGGGRGIGTLPRLPRVRGLTNLGNTCFFNAVLQCLAQTPFLLEVLKELAEPGEEFQLPGGSFKLNGEEDIELPMIKGSLSSWGGLTAALANALEELQSGGGVFTPSKLFEKLCNKCPQFTGGYQHDSHELLRQLLESVRSEDLKRYQRVILQNLGYKDQDINSVSEEMRLKCKIYGNQAADRILRPEQVFRGFMVSTLTCQECFTVSSRHEYFLDMSLPVMVEKPQPPQRRKASPDLECPNALFNGINSNFTGNVNQLQQPTTNTFSPFFLHPTISPIAGPTKSQVKREKEKERKAKRAAKHHKNKQAQWLSFKTNGTNANTGNSIANNIGGSEDGNGATNANINLFTTNDKQRVPTIAGGATTSEEICSSSVSSSEHSDADIEDNLVDDNLLDVRYINTAASHPPPPVPPAPPLPPIFYLDNNGNNQHMDEVAQHMDKDSLEEDENDSGIATSPLHACTGDATSSSSTSASAPATISMKNNNSAAEADVAAFPYSCEDGRSNSVLSFGLSEKGASLVRQLSLGDNNEGGGLGHKKSTVNKKASTNFLNGTASPELSKKFDRLKLKEHKQSMRQKRIRTQSYSDWCTTIAPRYQCDDGECSVQSCLNNFTAVELMTGNNKVGCESCTKRINGDDPKAATVNTNATKQFLISSPPAVLILHLKRFQLGPRCIFRKLARAVNFPFILDVAPFCGSKVKNLPNIDRRQKKLLYALYGIVEHSGGMYGGHYTAYVKVRPKLVPDDKRWKFLPHGSKAELDQDDEQLKKLEELLAKEKARELRLKTVDDSDDLTSSNSSISNESHTHTIDEDDDDYDYNNDEVEDCAHNMEEASGDGFGPNSSNSFKTVFGTGSATGTSANNIDDEAANVEVPYGKWYYVSDSRVQEVSEETVLKSQAYLLFYERIY